MPSWTALIDESIPSDSSITLRYHQLFDALDLDCKVGFQELKRASISEGAVLMKDPLVYKGVEIFVIDESSRMTTGTYKDLDASLVMAR